MKQMLHTIKSALYKKNHKSTTLNALIKTYSIDTKIGWCVEKKERERERERYMPAAKEVC